MEYWTRIAASVCLDVGRQNHLGPFLGLVGDEFAEISRRACKHRAAQIGKPCFEFYAGGRKFAPVIDSKRKEDLKPVKVRRSLEKFRSLNSRKNSESSE